MITKSSSKKGLSLGAAALLSSVFCLSAPTFLTPELPASSVYAQSPGKVRNISCDFVPEPGCPVAPSSMRCELDVDPFDAPMDTRVYLDYRNNSDRPVSAVKFRLRFVDAQGRDRGTFHAVDMYPVAPQGGHGLKAKRDFTLHPAVVAVKVRVLQVKYGDGSDWSSEKMRELAQPGGGSSAAQAAAPPAEDSGGLAEPAAPAYAPPAASPQPQRQPLPQQQAQTVQTGVRGKSYEVGPSDAVQNYVPAASSAAAAPAYMPPAAAAPAATPAGASAAAMPANNPAMPANSAMPVTAAPAANYSNYKYKGPEPVNKPYSPLDDAPAK